jgi:hypothetical protein
VDIQNVDERKVTGDLNSLFKLFIVGDPINDSAPVEIC